ncbi:MAG: competence/damage-inducible protein A [Gammaproteobacteria bacterium]
MSMEPAGAAVVVIGNEILSGRTRDANVQAIGSALGTVGIRLREVRIVEDRVAAIVEAVDALRARYAYVFTTGGIGPTHDDITTDAIGTAFGREVRHDPQAVELLTRYYGPTEATEIRLRMARVPVGATLIDNPVSAAPGFRIENVFVLPGVPRILQGMLPGVLATLPGGPPILSRTVTAWVRESDVAAELAVVQARHPGLDVGSYPFVRDGRFGTALVVRGNDAAGVDLAAGDIAAFLRARGVEFDEGGEPAAS